MKIDNCLITPTKDSTNQTQTHNNVQMGTAISMDKDRLYPEEQYMAEVYAGRHRFSRRRRKCRVQDSSTLANGVGMLSRNNQQCSTAMIQHGSGNSKEQSMSGSEPFSRSRSAPFPDAQYYRHESNPRDEIDSRRQFFLPKVGLHDRGHGIILSRTCESTGREFRSHLPVYPSNRLPNIVKIK
jgi:hypothetical protein